MGDSVPMVQAWKAVEEFLYDTYEKGIWGKGYGLRIKKRQGLHLNNNFNILSIIEILEQPSVLAEMS